MRLFISRIAVGALASGLALTFLAGPASAASIEPVLPRQEKPVAQQTVTPDKQQTAGGVAPLSGWLGSCYVSRYSTFAGGWCDGNGPDYGYQGAVKCSNGWWYYNGPYRWAGDRRGSYSSCPSGTTATRGGVVIFYLGSYYGEVMV